MWDPYSQFESATLPNGLSVYVLHWPERAGAYFGFGIHSGAEQDLPGKEGSAHFMEHLTSCNISVSKAELEEFFELNSGKPPMLGITSFHSTQYAFRTLAEPALISRSLELFGEMLLNATFKNHMERERNVIIGEFQQHFGMPLKYELQRRMVESVFPNTVRMRMLRPLGTMETILSLTEADLQQFYDTHYTPVNMSVVVVGELTLERVLSHLEKSPFGTRKNGIRTPAPTSLKHVPLPRDQLEEVEISEHMTGVTSANYDTIAQVPGIFTVQQLEIFSTMLDRELHRAIREERSWAYSIGNGSSWLSGVYEYGIGIPALDPLALPEIESVVTDVIARLPEKKGLLERAKQLESINHQFKEPPAQGIMSHVLDMLFSDGRIQTGEENAEALDAVSIDDIAALSASLSRERRRTCLYKP